MLNFFPNINVPTGKQFDRPLTSYLGVELNERNDGEFILKFDWAFNPGHKKGGCPIRILFKWDRNILFVRNKLSRKCVEIRKSAVSALQLTYLKASRRGPDTAKVFVRLIFYWPCGQLFPPYPPTLHVKKLHPTHSVKGNCKPAISNSCW